MFKNTVSFSMLSIFLLPMMTPVVAQVATGQPADPKTQMGTCSEPTFGISWTGYNDATLTAEADPPQTFVITLDYLEEMSGEDGSRPDSIQVRPEGQSSFDSLSRIDDCPEIPTFSNSGTTFCLTATREGSAMPLSLDRRPILKSSGLLGIRYKALRADLDRLPEMCSSRKEGPRKPIIRALDKHLLAFDVGIVNNLQGDGGWESNAEAAFSGRSRWYRNLLVGFDLRYSAVGADNPEGEDEDGGDGDDPMAGGEMETDDDSSGSFNPFAAGGGILEGDLYAVWSPIPDAGRLGLLLGGGFSTVPGDTDSLETRQRYFAGLRLSVEGYNAGRPGDSLQNSKGFIQLGVAKDDLWEDVIVHDQGGDGEDPVRSDESERIFLEAELELPRIGTSAVRTLVRLDVNLPTSGDGPSDVRVSALVSVDPREWFSGSRSQ